jgi:hypothetical protein
MKKIIILSAMIGLFSCNQKSTCPDLGEIPAEGDKFYAAIGTNRDGTKSPQQALIYVNITSRYDSVLKKQVLVIDSTRALLRHIKFKDTLTGKDTTRLAWIATTRDSVKLINDIPLDSLVK